MARYAVVLAMVAALALAACSGTRPTTHATKPHPSAQSADWTPSAEAEHKAVAALTRAAMTEHRITEAEYVKEYERLQSALARSEGAAICAADPTAFPSNCRPDGTVK